MATDPLSRKVYLHSLPDDLLPARYSGGSRRRTGQLRQYLRDFHHLAKQRLNVADGAELLVINSKDWHRLFNYSYGLPFTRNKTGGGVSIVVAADYPNKLIHRFDDVFVRAVQAGQRVPGDVREFLDLLAGHEWGHAAANLSGLRTRIRWLDELMASYLFLTALQETGMDGMLGRFLAWARLGVVGSSLEQARLDDFEYPRMKQRLDKMLWFQGMFTLQAYQVLLVHGWDFPKRLQTKLIGVNKHDVVKVLLVLEPSFADWFLEFEAKEI